MNDTTLGGSQERRDAVAETSQCVLDLIATNLPLPEGLRAAAEESPSSVARRSLTRLADALEQGQSLEAAIADPQHRLPEHVVGLIGAAIRSGRLAPLLMEMVEQQRKSQDEWRKCRTAIAYPFWLCAVSVVLTLALPMIVSTEFRLLLESLEVRVTYGTRWALWFGDYGAPVCLGSFLILFVLVLVAHAMVPRAIWASWMSSVPCLGAIWRWSALAEYLRNLSVLVEAELPLPRAVRLAADSIQHEDLSATAATMAELLDQGHPFNQIIRHEDSWPLSITPVIEWGERTGSLAEALRSAAEFLEGRVQTRARWVRVSFPPLVFFFVATMVLMTFVAIYLPLFTMLRSLMS